MVTSDRENDRDQASTDYWPRNRSAPRTYLRLEAQRSSSTLTLPGLQVGQQLGRGFVAQIQIALQTLGHDIAYRSRDSVIVVRNRRHSLLRPANQAGDCAIRLERHLP